MSVNKHNESRRWLTINSGLFLGSSVLYGIFFFAKFIKSLFSNYTSINLIILLGSLGLFYYFGLRNFFGAWSSFKELDYNDTKSKGVTSWMVVAGMILLGLI